MGSLWSNVLSLVKLSVFGQMGSLSSNRLFLSNSLSLVKFAVFAQMCALFGQMGSVWSNGLSLVKWALFCEMGSF